MNGVLLPAASITIGSVMPGACGGVVTRISVSLMTSKSTPLMSGSIPATSANVTAVALRKPVPVNVTTVPPSSVPEAGSMSVIWEKMLRNSKSTASESPAGSTTATGTIPGTCRGVVTVISVSLTTTKPVPRTSSPPTSNSTPVAPVNPEPVRVMNSPPASSPSSGTMASRSDASAPYSNGRGAELPARSTTTTGTTPAAWGGVTRNMEVSLRIAKPTETPSMVTSFAPRKPLPVINTNVPPVSGPAAGLSETATEGSDRYS